MPSLLHSALGDFRRTWRQLLIARLLSVAITIAVATPLLGLLLKAFLMLTDDRVLTDTDIAAFFLHPLGLVGLLILGAFSLGVFLALQGVVMVIGFGAAEERRVTYLDALLYVARRARSFARLALRIVGTTALVALPFLAALVGVYYVLLDEYDINYYLAVQPPAFRSAVGIAAGLGIVLGLILARIAAGWLISIPVLLFEGGSGTEALRESRRRTQDMRWSLVGWLVLWAAGALGIAALGSYVAGRIGGWLVPELGRPWLLVGAGLVLALSLATLTNFTIRFVTDSVLPLAVVRLYASLSESGRLTPSIAEPGTLGEGRAFQLPGKRFLGAAVLVVLAAGGAAYLAARSIESEDVADVIAHRGASGGAPENTMAAFELAHEVGADWIELDVQETADGEVVVAHDSDFMKQARMSTKVWDATAADLAELDIGSWYGPEFADQRVATLREVLEWARGRINVVIELKDYGHTDRLEERVVAIVEETDMVEHVQVMSLKLERLRSLSELRPDWPRGLLNTASLGDQTRLNVDFLALNASAATRAQIRRAHARGMRVYVWTVDDPVQMSVFLSRGVDGLITDEPALARRVLELREGLSPIGHFVVWMAGESGLLESSEAVSDEGDA